MNACPPTGPFAGMPTPALQAALTSAQQALIALASGTSVTTVSYGLGGEQKSVTYTRAKIADLRLMIQDLQRALGLVPKRGSLRFSY